MPEQRMAESINPAPSLSPTDGVDPGVPSERIGEAAGDEDHLKQGNRRIRHHERFHPGDLVEVNRNKVNCRAWMSTVAPVRHTLQRGDRGTLLSGPVRFDGHYWVKVRLDDHDRGGYVSSRYLGVIESRSAPVPDAVAPADFDPAQRVPYRAGDRLTTGVELGLRAGPGVHFPIERQVARNAMAIALDAPTLSDSVAWVPVRVANDAGWVAAQHTTLLARQCKWIEVDLPRQELIAWDDECRVSSSPISSGKAGYPTPAGAFTITQKIPVRRLRATVRGERWDIPAVPWLLLFKRGGFYIHSAYWHDDFGTPSSHGCVTLPVDYAEWLFEWTPANTPIWIHY